MPLPRIPDHKKYFRIGEVSRIVGVEAYVLRYWESEIPQIRPSRADSNQRTYQRKDLEILLEVKRLLYDEKLDHRGDQKAASRDAQRGAPETWRDPSRPGRDPSRPQRDPSNPLMTERAALPSGDRFEPDPPEAYRKPSSGRSEGP